MAKFTFKYQFGDRTFSLNFKNDTKEGGEDRDLVIAKFVEFLGMSGYSPSSIERLFLDAAQYGIK